MSEDEDNHVEGVIVARVWCDKPGGDVIGRVTWTDLNGGLERREVVAGRARILAQLRMALESLLREGED